MSNDLDDDLRKDLCAQAKQLDGALWCGMLFSEMSQQELIGVIMCLKRSADRNTEYYQDRLAFLLPVVPLEPYKKQMGF